MQSKPPHETEALIDKPQQQQTTFDDGGWIVSFQKERKVKYKGNPAFPTTVLVLYYINVVYVMVLEGLAIAEFAGVSASKISSVIQNQSDAELVTSFVGTTNWAIIISLQFAFSAGWWLYCIIIACLNFEDERANKPEARYPPTVITVTAATLTFLAWMMVTGSTITVHQLDGDFSNVTRSGAFLIQMILVLLIGILTTYIQVLRAGRIICDFCLCGCRSNCRDC